MVEIRQSEMGLRGVDELARRLKVGAEPEGSPRLLVAGRSGKKYDVAELLEAFLDRLDERIPPRI